MSVLNDGNNLPGVLIDFEAEISQDYDPSKWGSTESMVVIGTAFDGPSGTLTQVYNSDMGRYYFGAPYDAKTRRSATLTVGIQAAYEAGCRTIWAMRLGGKDLYKDFNICENSSKLFLRVSSLYSTNLGKQCGMLLDVRNGYESVTFFKPASKATIREKKAGVVDDENTVIINTIKLNENNGLTRDDRLTELINTFNSETTNNVLRLSVVDVDGNDVTNTPEAQDLCIGSLFSGLYLIGRDANAEGMPAYTSIKTKAVIDDSSAKPYSSYSGAFYRTIDFNNDVTTAYPIWASSYNELKTALMNVSVTTSADYDFIETAGIIDRIWTPDSIDYEEVDMTNFEKYVALGNGFAITAKALDRGVDMNGIPRRPRIIETPSDDPNRIVAIKEGIYSILQNAEANYRVLVAANADDKITAKLPKADDFLVATPESIFLFGDNDGNGDGNMIIATAKVDENDLTMPKAYKFHFKKIDEDDATIDTIEDVYADKVAHIVAGLEPEVGDPYDLEKIMETELSKGEVPNGTFYMVFEDSTRTTGHLVRVDNGEFAELQILGLEGELYDVDNKIYIGTVTDSVLTFTPVLVQIPSAEAIAKGSVSTGDGVYNDKQYFLVDNDTTVYVARIANVPPPGATDVDETEPITLEPLGALDQMMGDNDEKTLIYVENCYGKVNNITITTGATGFIPLLEFRDILQDDDVLGRLFTFTLTQDGTNLQDQYPEDIELGYINGDATKLYFEQEYTDPNTGAIISAPGKDYTLTSNKAIVYDYTKYIPYRTNDNFARQLAQHCAYTSLLTHTTYGVIGYSPLRNLHLSSIAARADELVKADFSLYAKKDNGRNMLLPTGEPFSIGDRIAITAFQHSVVDPVTNYYTSVNGAATYAGAITVLPIDQSTTMQPIGITSMAFEFSNAQLKDISNAGFVVVRNTARKGLCVVDGVTMAPGDLYRRRFSVVRTLNEVGQAIRLASEPFIGKKNNIQNRNALKTAVDSAINQFVDTLIWDYRFEVVNLNSYTDDAFITINYWIFPMNEIREVNNVINVTRQSTANA